MTHAKLSKTLRQLTPLLVQTSHDIHAHPEIGGEEKYACDLLTSIAAERGFSITRPVAELSTAFIARRILPGEAASTGPKIAYLAEYDALPKIGHACGHNWIAATSLGAALALAQLAEEENYAGEVFLIGTPAEESFGGKIVLCEAGVFDKLDVVMMVHPSRRTLVNRTSLASCSLQVEFTGKAAHAAASPEAGLNALDAVRLLFSAVDMLKRGLPDDVRLPGIITHGGDAANVIPDRATARFSLRAATKKKVDFARERVEQCARGAAIATGTTFTAELYERQYMELLSNPVLVQLFQNQLQRLGITERQVEAKGTGSLDIGNVSHYVPAIHPDFTITGPNVGIHTDEFREAAVSPEADSMIPIAAEALAGTGLALIQEPQKISEAKAKLQMTRRL